MAGDYLNTAAWAFKQAMFTTAQTVFATQSPDTYVCMGLPSTLTPFEIVSVGAVTASQVQATLSPARGREETLTITVTFDVFQGGQDDAQPSVDGRAFQLMQMLEQQIHYVQNGIDGSTLGGVVRECFLTELTQDSTSATEGTTAGRAAVVVATFTAKARIRYGAPAE